MNSLFYFKTLKKYATFKGRASRMEFWTFTTINLIIYLGLVLYYMYSNQKTVIDFFETDAILLADIFNLAVIVPTLAVGYRRVHDVNHKGWHSLVPLYNIYLFILRGTPGANKYGDIPSVS